MYQGCNNYTSGGYNTTTLKTEIKIKTAVT